MESDVCPPLKPDDGVNVVVMVMHGIRDFAHWTDDLGERIEELGLQRDIRVESITSSYGYFPMLGFLLQPERQDNVRWFADEYTEALAKYPNARICFVGHSNGTYLLASALQRYAAMAFDDVVFAGSVVPRNFPWDRIGDEQRVGRVRNYVASRDWVVAICPAVFETLFKHSDLGSAGHNGFLETNGRKHMIEFADGGHGAAIVPDNFDAIARFLLGEDVPANEHGCGLVTGGQSSLCQLANKFCWVIWLVSVLIVVAACFGSAVLHFGDHWHQDACFLAQWIPWWVPPMVGLPIVYAILRFV